MNDTTGGGAADTYGVLDAQWTAASRTALIQALQARQSITQRP